MDDLIKRLEAATGPDRELDEAIYVFIHPTHRKTKDSDPVYGLPPIYEDENREYVVPEYTSSIDAALTLVPDGWFLTLDRYIISDEAKVNLLTWRVWLKSHVGDIDGDDPIFPVKVFAPGPTPAIALCIAALKARQ